MNRQIRVLFPDFDTGCDVCDNDVKIAIENAIFDYGGIFYGWRCAICRTVYNSDGEVIYVGGFEIEEYASA